MSTRPAWIAAVLAFGVFLLVGCSSPAPTAPPPPTKVPESTTAIVGTSGAGSMVEIRSLGDQVAFDKTSLTFPAGATIAVTLHNKATTPGLQHNWLLVKDGTVDSEAADGLKAGPGHGWIPINDPDVLAHTKLVNGAPPALLPSRRRLWGGTSSCAASRAIPAPCAATLSSSRQR